MGKFSNHPHLGGEINPITIPVQNIDIHTKEYSEMKDKIQEQQKQIELQSNKIAELEKKQEHNIIDIMQEMIDVYNKVEDKEALEERWKKLISKEKDKNSQEQETSK